MTTRETGNLGEDIACAFLRRKGYKVIDRNVRKKWGEVDIVATRGAVLHIVEVKSGSRVTPTLEGARYRPEEHVTADKVLKLRRMAEWYVAEKRWAGECQIDVIGIDLDVEKKRATCRMTSLL
jgi:putative endonuclease